MGERAAGANPGVSFPQEEVVAVVVSEVTNRRLSVMRSDKKSCRRRQPRFAQNPDNGQSQLVAGFSHRTIVVVVVVVVVVVAAAGGGDGAGGCFGFLVCHDLGSDVIGLPACKTNTEPADRNEPGQLSGKWERMEFACPGFATPTDKIRKMTTYTPNPFQLA